MCGISGIINRSDKVVNSDNIKDINDLISHRGPDDEGFYFEKNFAFGHRRLSILDLSDDGHQPMHYLERYTITYNGEIYNYIELKKDLINNGYIFTSNTDTEVILASYDYWGEKCVNKFNGMWAFALYDKSENIIFCSRDRFGIKPFYYTQKDDMFIFGSEIKQLLYFFPEREVNKEILIDYLVAGFQEHSTETFFQNIFKLPASHNLRYDLTTNKYKIKQYYFIEENKEKLNLQNSINKYESELRRSIAYRLRSDVKVGTCLSGGLDSSAVASIASKEYATESTNKFTAIHAKSIEKSSDESKYAKIVAEHANLDLNIIEPSIKDFKNSIEEVVYTQEEPFGSTSIFMQYFVMKKAKEIGCTVMLDGQGGDETLLGYDKYYPSVYFDVYKKKGIVAAIKTMYDSSKSNQKMNLFNIVKFTIGFLFSTARKNLYKKQCSFIKKEYFTNFEVLDKLSKSFLSIVELQKLEITNTNLPALLRYEDKNSMRNSIETRLPFIDYKTLECALGINNEFKIKDGWSKYILRKIIDRFLPIAIVYRKDKLGFVAPQDTWLKEIMPIMKEEIKNSLILVEICNMCVLEANFDNLKSSLKWRLYNIAIWEKIYNVKLKEK